MAVGLTVPTRQILAMSAELKQRYTKGGAAILSENVGLRVPHRYY